MVAEKNLKTTKSLYKRGTNYDHNIYDKLYYLRHILSLSKKIFNIVLVKYYFNSFDSAEHGKLALEEKILK